MRGFKTGGVPPRDRRLDRRKVAIAAVAALFLFAAVPAKAGIVEMLVDPNSSFMQVAQFIDLSAVFGNPQGTNVFNTVPQVLDPDGAGPLTDSDTSFLYGNMYVDLGTGTSINFLPAGTVSVGINPNGGAAGYRPFDPVVSDPVHPPGPTSLTPNANYGLRVGSPLNLWQVEYNLIGTVLTASSTPVPIVGTNFNFVPGDHLFLGTGGRIAFTSSLGVDTGDVVGDPLAAFGTAAATPGTWDPADLTAGPLGTLTLPIASFFSIVLQAELSPGVFAPIPVGFFANGQIVATPNPIPEPSTMVLLGFGVVGLVACGWRLRKRRA